MASQLKFIDRVSCVLKNCLCKYCILFKKNDLKNVLVVNKLLTSV